MNADQILKAVKYLVIILVLVFLFGAWNAIVTRCDNRIPEGSVVVRQSFIDSLEYIANLPPDTVKVEKIVKGDPVVVYRDVLIPWKDPSDTTINHYSDTLNRVGIDARVNLKIRGTLLGINWWYRPVTQYTSLTIERKVPYPVRYEIEVPVPTRGFFYQAGVGTSWDLKEPIGSMGVFYLTKKSNVLGIEAGYFQKPYILFNFGTKF